MKLKLFTNRPDLRSWSGKTFLVMRLTLYILLLGVSQILAVETYSQSAKINLDINNQSVKEVLSEMGLGLGMKFDKDLLKEIKKLAKGK